MIDLNHKLQTLIVTDGAFLKLYETHLHRIKEYTTLRENAAPHRALNSGTATPSAASAETLRGLALNRDTRCAITDVPQKCAQGIDRLAHRFGGFWKIIEMFQGSR